MAQQAAAASESSRSGAKTPTSSAADDEALAQRKSYSDLVSTLPARGGWVSLVRYQGYWLTGSTPAGCSTSSPSRSSTSLAPTTSSSPPTSNAAPRGSRRWSHPLLTVHPQEAVPHLEVHTPGHGLADIERLPSPRLLGTHLPLSLLPPAVTSTSTTGCRVVYLCRQPKDVFVSLWHFVNGVLDGIRPPVEMGAALGLFCEGVSPFGPVWEHYLEYWKESLARPEQVLFMRYEEMLADPVSAVKRLAGFFAVPFAEEEERAGVPEEIVRLCSFETLSGLESNRTGDLDCGDNTVIGKSTFFRKGKVGDWENHMTKLTMEGVPLEAWSEEGVKKLLGDDCILFDGHSAPADCETSQFQRGPRYPFQVHLRVPPSLQELQPKLSAAQEGFEVVERGTKQST